MMEKKSRPMTDEEVEFEISRLRESEAVNLAIKYDEVRHERWRYLHRLRGLEKRGLELAAAGVTMESLCGMED